jgi:hypothetical protein
LKEAQSCALKITDASTRDRVLVQVVRRHSSEKHLEDAIALSRRISDETARVELLVMLSGVARASMGNTRAAELLNEAGACSLKAKPSLDRARSLVMIASSFSAFDTTRSFEFFQSAIKAIEDITKQRTQKTNRMHLAHEPKLLNPSRSTLYMQRVSKIRLRFSPGRILTVRWLSLASFLGRSVNNRTACSM